MHKKIIDEDLLQESKTRGMTDIASVVKKTLGPGGKLVIVQRQGQALDGTPLGPRITKDGVSVAEECGSKDPIRDLVIQTVKSICKKTNADAGDGTTTAIVLGEAILSEAVDVEEEHPQLVRESIEEALQGVVAKLKDKATPVKDMDIIKQVATIASNGDTEIGDIIGQAFDHVGAEGVVTVDEGSSNKVTLDIVDGYQFNRGAEGRNNFFNNSALTQFKAEKAAVLMYDGDLQNFTHLIPALQMLMGIDGQGKPTKKMPPLIIIANEFSHEVIQFLIIQKTQTGMPVCCVRGPHMTSVRTGYYDDLAIYTNGKRLGNGAESLTAVTPEHFGTIDKVVVDKYKTTLYSGLKDKHEKLVIARVDQLKIQKESAETPYDIQILNDRIAALTSGVAKIGVGGQTELEIKEKYDRIEDALNASRAAIQEGIIPGGGTTLLKIAQDLLQKGNNATVGEIILGKALQTPFKQILDNIGMSEKDIEEIRLKLISVENDNTVYDARYKKFVDATSAGIIDPVKVTRTALENAVSIAALLSTAGGAIIYQPDK